MLVSASTLAPCVTASLSTYQSNYPYPSGCAIGILDYSDFTYHPVSDAPLESELLVTPTGQGFNISLASNQPITASAGELVQFEIDYNILIDPAPILGGARLSVDPPTGNVVITQYFCNDSQYVYTGLCFGASLDKLSVGTLPPYSTTASITFSNPAQRFEEVGILFTLDATGKNGPASFDGLTATSDVLTLVPEPSTTLMLGLLLLGGGYKITKRTQFLNRWPRARP